MSDMFKPACGSHSLLETVFFVQFAPEIDLEVMPQLGDKLQSIHQFLPNRSSVSAVKIELRPEAQQVSSLQATGWQFARTSPEGDTEWLLRFMPDGLSIHCLAYTRWDEVWPIAEKALVESLKVLPSGVGLNAIGLKAIDRFEYAGEDLAMYQLDALIRRNSPHIADRVFSAGHRWHCNSGWFVSIPAFGREMNDREALNQINVSGGPISGPAGEQTFVTIDHNQVVKGGIAINPAEHGWLGPVMKKMHKDNIVVLSEILVDYMIRRINLTVKAEA